MSDHLDDWDPDSEYIGMKLDRNSDGRVVLAFGSVLAKKGDKVRYLDENGHEWEREMARKHFKAGDLLTVSAIGVGHSSSKYYLEGIPSDWNTVMFERVEEEVSPTDEVGAVAEPEGRSA